MLPVLIVDGYNVVAQDPEYGALFDNDPDTARTRLVDDIASFAHGAYDATVVFDGHGNPASDGSPTVVGGVTVVFSPAGVEADTVIEAMARMARERGLPVTVATSDQQTRYAVSGPGVVVQSASDFASGLLASATDSIEYSTESTRTPIKDRVDETTRRALERWARGLGDPEGS